ncbi:MAG TPA: hypothetical protein VN228_20980, partial [Pyrinomonadaceae bacterium]|nr:hypothetical protein [Pyrinomonadaceae bacterium]
LLKPSAEPEAATAAGAAKPEAAPAAEAEAKPAARFEFGRDEGAAARLFPQTTQDPSAQPTPAAQPYVPLTAEQKMSRAFKSAFLSPQGYALSAFRATLTQLGEDELPDKDFEDEFGDWAARFGRNVANRATRTLFASGVYPVLFKQDPRYERATKKGFLNRTGHAVSRVFVTRGDNGNLQPNVSRFAGVVTAAGLSNLWERSTPGHDRVGTDATLRRIARSFPNDMIYNVIREFLPDVIGIFRK